MTTEPGRDAMSDKETHWKEWKASGGLRGRSQMSDKPWNSEVERIRKAMMERFSDKLSMEEIAEFAYSFAVECTAPAPQPASLERFEKWWCDVGRHANAVRKPVAKEIWMAAATPQVTPTPDFPAILERERTLVAEGVTNVKNAIKCREWLTEGRGSYEWNDDRWHGEFAAAISEILTAIQPLERIAADWTNCPQKWEDVQKAREELKGKPWNAAKVLIESEQAELVSVVERLANHGSVDDYTVAGIRAELRDALHTFKFKKD